MGKRARRRERGGAAPPLPELPPVGYRDGEDVLVLRCVLSPGTRAAYGRTRSGEALAPGAAREDAWHRAVEFLVERLAVTWAPAGVPYEGQQEVLARFRAATPEERAWVRERLREHLAEPFPDLEAP